MAIRRWVLASAMISLLMSAAACAGPAVAAEPPRLTVQGAGAAVDLRAWSYCWGNTCADGQPPASGPSVGTGDRVSVSSRDIGLRLSAEFVEADQKCARRQQVELGTIGKQMSVWPAGPAGTYDVHLHVEGAQGHSASYSFRWTTTRDGVWPAPASSAAVLADNNGTTTSYGVELNVQNLAATPRRASAAITVTSAEGLTTVIRPKRVRSEDGCDVEGSVRFEAPEAETQATVGSGSAPFRYRLLLVMDGTTYRGTAVWPDDQLADFAPFVQLAFRPKLPALPRK